MAGHHCVAILCLLAVTVSAQDPNELVNCYANDNCGGTPSGQGVTREACCSNLLNPVGYSVQVDLEGCQQCPIVIGFSPDNFTGIEQGEGHPVTAGYLSGRPRTGGSLNLQLITGSEATGQDVRIDTRVRVFNNLPLSTIMITLVLDGVSQENNETFSIEYLDPPLTDTNLFPVGVPVTVGHLNGTILDRDSINFQLSEDDYFQQEELNAMIEILILKDQGIRLANPVRFRVTPLTVPEAEARGIIADFSRPGVEDTPISPIRANTNDFDATIFEVTLRSDEDLLSGDTGVTVFIPIVDDAIDEAQSQFFIVYLEILDATNFDLITVSRTISTCIIDDDDGTRIGYALPVYSFPEPDFETLFSEVTLIREGGTLSEQTFFVAISVGDPGGTTRSATLESVEMPSGDYRISTPGISSLTLTFPAAAESITFNFFLNGDESPEGLEAFRASSTPQVGSPTFQPPIQPPIMGGAFQFTEIQILDNDIAVVGFVRPNYTISETGDSQQVCVQVFNPPPNEELVPNIFLVYRTRTGTADGSDFVEVNEGLLAIIAGMSDGMPRVQCFDISINDDTVDEDVESFTVTLELDEMQSGIIVQPNLTTIFIEDNDVPIIGFERTTYQVPENNSVVTEICAVLMPPPALAEGVTITVTIAFIDDTAQSPEDYNEPMSTLTFDSDTSRSCVDFTALEDDVVEGQENLAAVLMSEDDVILLPDEAVINIVETEVVLVMFALPEYTFNEGDGQGSVRLLKSDSVSESFTVRVTGGPSEQTDVEVSAAGINTVVTFGAGPSAPNFIDIPFAITNDEVGLEAVEMYTVTFEILSLTNLVQPGMPQETKVNILDDDPAAITFEDPVYSATELSGVAMVCLIKTPETVGPITIDDITTSPGTATAGDDYTPDPFSVTFGTGASDRQCINIPLLADTIAEPTEDFTVSLNLPSATNPMVFPGTIPSAVVNIIDSGNQQTVNDTVIGDPLFTVPILVSEEQLAALNLDRVSLCYEVHGSSDQWFNLVTDECATVNAQYFGLTENLNFIDEIGVRAVDDSNQCVNIRVNVNNCTAEVNDVSLERYSMNGINVRRYNNRVRISVPNCNELTLVMWAICEMRTVDNPDVPDTKLTAKMIKYVVMRGLNFGHNAAHGLIGQFWNIPVEVTPFTGQLRDGSQAQGGQFLVNMTSLDEPRAYIGWLHSLTWDFEEGPCLYVGDRQAGPIYEVTNPNDGVIENIYQDYKVESAFSEEDYIFGLFSEDRCGSGLPSVTPSMTTGGPIFPPN